MLSPVNSIRVGPLETSRVPQPAEGVCSPSHSVAVTRMSPQFQFATDDRRCGFRDGHSTRHGSDRVPQGSLRRRFTPAAEGGPSVVDAASIDHASITVCHYRLRRRGCAQSPRYRHHRIRNHGTRISIAAHKIRGRRFRRARFCQDQLECNGAVKFSIQVRTENSQVLCVGSRNGATAHNEDRDRRLANG